MVQNPTGKKLLLLRHVQTAPYSDEGDHGRPLTLEGQKQAIALGAVMKEKGLGLDLVLCSSAKRTRQTWDGLSQNITDSKTEYLDILYRGAVDDYLDQIHAVSDDVQNLMIVAHNPCIYELAFTLVCKNNHAMASQLSLGYAPGTLTVFSVLQDHWHEIEQGNNDIFEFIAPADYQKNERL